MPSTFHFGNSVQQNLSPGWMIPVPNFYPSHLLHILLGSLNCWPTGFLAHRELVLRPHGLGLWILALSIQKMTHQKRKHKAGRNQKQNWSSKGPSFSTELKSCSGRVQFHTSNLTLHVFSTSANFWETSRIPHTAWDAFGPQNGPLFQRMQRANSCAESSAMAPSLATASRQSTTRTTEFRVFSYQNIIIVCCCYQYWYHYDNFIMIITIINYYMVWLMIILIVK